MCGNPSYSLLDVTVATCDHQSLGYNPGAPFSMTIIQSDIILWLHLSRVIQWTKTASCFQRTFSEDRTLRSLFLDCHSVEQSPQIYLHVPTRHFIPLGRQVLKLLSSCWLSVSKSGTKFLSINSIKLNCFPVIWLVIYFMEIILLSTYKGYVCSNVFLS